MVFSEEEVDKVIQDAHKRFKELFESDDFKHHETKQGISVHVKKQGSEPYIVKGVGVIDHSFQDILDLINPKNSYEVAATYIPKISERNHLKREVYSAGVFMVADREFIKACDVIKGEEGEYFWVNAPIEGHPETSGVVRGETPILTWHFKESDKNKTTVTMIIQTNFAGYIPQYVIDQALLGSPYTFNVISDLLKKNKK